MQASAPPSFHVAMVGCPIEASLGVLGRKWAMAILRDLAFFHRQRFRDFLEANEPLTPRVLSRRLRELCAAGLLTRRQTEGAAVYELTPKGRDAIPILSALFHFGAKHHPAAVFADGKPHTLAEVFPGQHRLLLGDLLDYAQGGPAPAGAAGARGAEAARVVQEAGPRPSASLRARRVRGRHP